MLGYFPSIYPDELLYSQLARYYHGSGYMGYTFAAEDLFENRRVRPDIEFVNSYTQDTYDVITSNLPIDEVIMKHTMLPYYGRFLTPYRREKAYFALKNMSGDYNNLLAVPKSKELRYLRFCPLCVKEDRGTYGETYWHRLHQMMGVDICPIHFCKLMNSSILISGRASPKLITAEEVIDNTNYECIISENSLEKRLSRYISDVVESNLDLKNEVLVGDYISFRLSKTKYMTGKMRNMRALTEEYNRFYGTETELWRLQKVLTNDDFKLKNICMLAMFLNITVKELCNPRMEIAIPKTNKKKVYNAKKPGVKSKDWEEIDRRTLPKVKTAIQELQKSDKPKRITVYAIEKMLKLPSRQIESLPKCKNEILKYYETQEEFWARKVEWAVEKITEEGHPLNWKHIRDLTNMRKENLVSSFPYLSSQTKRKIESIV